MTNQASAFTAQATARKTRPEQAHGGTLELDTIALLRMVEQGETLAAIDHVAEALKANLGRGTRAIVALTI